MHIDIYSDVVCPWCYIGKKRLDQVLKGPVGEGVTVAWRPHQLYPNMPRDGMNRLEFLKARYGENADPGRIPERIRGEAEQVGLTLDFAAGSAHIATLAGIVSTLTNSGTVLLHVEVDGVVVRIHSEYRVCELNLFAG